MKDLTARLFVLLQRLLPKQLLTRFVFRVARIRQVPIKNFLIRRFVQLFKVNTSELVHPVPDGYPTFNHFFVRELSAEARTVDRDANTITSPVDGTVSACGCIEGDQIFQAKGLRYSLTDLIATDTDEAAAYVDGAFATLYLAPYNYHRVHAPLAGTVKSVHYVPGTLFSVNDATVRYLPSLFARNERVVCHIETGSGPMIIVFVGAMNVGTINTKWTGDIRPRRHGVVEDIALDDQDLDFDKGDPLGWFNMGSTIILILPPGSSNDFDVIEAGQSIRMGEAIGRLQDDQ